MGVTDLFNTSGDFLDTLRSSRNQYRGIQAPQNQWNTYAPEAVAPHSAQAQTVADDPLAKSAQMSALSRMGDLAQNGMSAEDQQGYENARSVGQQVANAGSGAAMQNAQARGVAGSGMEFANREIANQQGAQRAQQAGLQQAADSARQKALYNQAYMQGMGNLRNQNTNLNAQNAGILNQFNMANTNSANQAQAMNSMNNNQAQLINTQGKNGVANQNFQNQMGLASAIGGANKDLAQGQAAQDAATQAQYNRMMSMGIGMMGMGM